MTRGLSRPCVIGSYFSILTFFFCFVEPLFGVNPLSYFNDVKAIQFFDYLSVMFNYTISLLFRPLSPDSFQAYLERGRAPLFQRPDRFDITCINLKLKQERLNVSSVCCFRYFLRLLTAFIIRACSHFQVLIVVD